MSMPPMAPQGGTPVQYGAAGQTPGYQQPGQQYQQPAVVVQNQPAPQYQQPGPSVVVVGSPAQQPIMGATYFGRDPARTTCQFCRAEIVTTVMYETGMMCWLGIAAICFVGLFFPILWLGCCLIPLCIDACKDAVHTCSACGQRLGTKSAM
eukprot:NODE_6052_length_657_cov_77.299342_g5131_i0.p2 GENE.NODE_6052_length_657_cov_77.299342_g5131_i0~~NODE_6052_length_657_cov_77.299342_g5131_i0.p2  ORF type:complete len:151 (-),score=34.49 NODE_6052_length_657_cov_77.299342_g5131_i0:84-536(-)